MGLSYLIRRISGGFRVPASINDWEGEDWEKADVLVASHFHARSSEHRPGVRARVLHDGRKIFLRFDVADRYVICRAMEYQDPVYLDSCVEFFFQPHGRGGYFNLEMNCGGTKLMSFIEDPKRIPGGFAKFQMVKAEDGEKIVVHHSMPTRVDPEISGPVDWRMGAIIPVEAIEPYVGKLGELNGQRWKGNFFKCADKSSHPHWGTWSPIGEKLNFHQPEYFGDIRLE